MPRIVLLLLFLPLAAFAQSPVAPEVETVISGGYWEKGADSGRYRVVLLNSGFEQVTSRVLIEWLRDPRQANSVTEVVASVETSLSFGNSVASLGVTLTPLGKGKVRIVASGVISADPTKKVRAVFVATQPGQVGP